MLNFFRTHLKNYNDKIICELLEFGAPIGFEGKLDKCKSRVLNDKEGQVILVMIF